MHNHDRRLMLLEARRRKADASQGSSHRAILLGRLARMTLRFEDRDADIPLSARLETMSPAQHWAWSLRFDALPLSVHEVMRLHGRELGR